MRDLETTLDPSSVVGAVVGGWRNGDFVCAAQGFRVHAEESVGAFRSGFVHNARPIVCGSCGAVVVDGVFVRGG